MSVEERLARDRAIFIGGEINDKLALYAISYLMHLDSESGDTDIYLYINSPGGSVTAGMAIYDTMQYVSSDVVTVCMGMAASMGAFLLACGAPGKRVAMPNSTIMIHQPLYAYHGQATDMEIHVRYVVRLKERINQLLAERTGRPYEEVVRNTERDNFMTAQEALEFGLVDAVVGSKREVLERSR